MARRKGLTIKDVAKKAKVSTATVSYVLNNTPQVSQETRERVLRVVAELNYQRNTIAKTLRTSKSGTIGVIVEDMTVFNSPKLIDGINEYMDTVGYHIVLSNLRLNARVGHNFADVASYAESINEAVDVLLNRQIDGMIYIGEHPRDVTRFIDAGDKPIIYTYCYTSRKLDYTINYDDRQGGYDATKYLIDLGHERIAVICGLVDSMPTKQRLAGFENAHADHRLTVRDGYVASGDWEYQRSFELSLEFLSSDEPPTAVFAMNDLMAVGAIDAASRLGMNVPADLSVIGFDNREFGAYYNPKLTTVDLPLREMGMRSAETLHNLILGQEPEKRSVWLPCTVLPRNTTAPLSPSAEQRKSTRVSDKPGIPTSGSRKAVWKISKNAASTREHHELLHELSIQEVRIDDPFWNNRLHRNRTVTLRHQYQMLHQTGRIDNFRKAAGRIEGSFQGMFINDSDVYKWIEAACYAVIGHDDQELSRRIEELVSVVADAQEPDGYLNTYFALVEPDKKWTNLGMMHELYCAGHLFQAAVAHTRATGSTKLLDVACRLADHIDRIFRVEGKSGAPGHEEIELALVELYQITGESRYVELARLFLDRRGTPESGFRSELADLRTVAGYRLVAKIDNFETRLVDEFYRQFYLDSKGEYSGRYAQDHCPVREQDTVEGHAVRAMYLFSAVADIAAHTGDTVLRDMLRRLWDNMTLRRMYVTGGIGSDMTIEGFSRDYDLPNETAYSETCAAVGSVLWNHRMLKLIGDGRYGDVLELVLYNGLLAGVSLDGTKFFYVNPLSSEGSHHRKNWFHVACCPMNVARTLASLQRYVYLQRAGSLFVNLYISGEATFQVEDGGKVKLTQQTTYPWNERVDMSVRTDHPRQLDLHLRVPAWSKGVSVSVNGELLDAGDTTTKAGYVCVRRTWADGDRLSVTFEFRIERIVSHPAVSTNRGMVALQRGPVIYCLEQTDHHFPVEELILPEDAQLSSRYADELLEGCVVIEGIGWVPDHEAWPHALYSSGTEQAFRTERFTAVPYYSWDNREPGKMRVWIQDGRVPARVQGGEANERR